MSVRKNARNQSKAISPSFFRLMSALGFFLMVGLPSGCGLAKEDTSPSSDESKAPGTPGNMAGPTKQAFTLSLPKGCAEGTYNLAFDFASADPSRDEINFLLWAAATAYLRDEALTTAAVKAVGFSAVTFFDRSKATSNASGFQGMLLVKDGLRVLALRGSDEDIDWIANNRDTTRPGKASGLPGSVHDGFASQLESGWDDVSAALAKTDKKTPLLVTGHSLGAALATLFGTRLKQEGQTIGRVITFAGPRAGDVTFSHKAEALLGSSLVRVARLDDFVTMAPPSPATAKVGARIATLGKPEDEMVRKASALTHANYRHAGRTWILDGATGALKRLSGDSDVNDAKFLGVLFARKQAAAGNDSKLKAIDAELSGAHIPLAYVCPAFRPK